MLKKFANTQLTVGKDKILAPEVALHSEAITERFRTITAEIKKISPRSEDFLYFIARGIHAMEHAAIDPVSRKYDPKVGHVTANDGNGCCKVCGCELMKTASGDVIDGLWCETSQVDPFLNQNGDAFSERELLAEVADPQDPTKTIRAYQTFIGKGLFTDHKSSEVENIRGIILDAAYDEASKGVDLLIALDKKAYPELARQITAGYSTDVSMGCQVNYSLCSVCGNKAVTESDYCNHVTAGKGLARAGEKMCYEVNNGLNFIEISMVTNGADPRAKIKTVLASLNRLRQAQNRGNETVDSENQLILDSISRVESEVRELERQMAADGQPNISDNIEKRLANIEEQVRKIAQKTGGEQMVQDKQKKKAYMQGTVEPEIGKPFDMADKNYTQYWEDDKHLHGQGMDEGKEGLHSGYGLGPDEQVKKMYYRANAEQRRKMRAEMLSKMALDKEAYMQGTVEPEIGKPFDMADKNYTQYWEDDKHLHGQGMETGKEGLHPGYGLGSDENVKKELLRAKLRGRLEKSANPKDCRWTVFAGNEPILSVTAEEAYGSELNNAASDLDSGKEVTNFEWFASKPYGLNLIKAIQTFGLAKVAKQIEDARQVRTAQAAPQVPAPEAAGADMGMDMGMEGMEGMDGDLSAPEGEAPEHAERMLEAVEAIRTAVDSVDEATAQISANLDDISGEYGDEAAAEGEDLAGELGEASTELDELGGEMAAAPGGEATAALKGLVRVALRDTDRLLKKAEAYLGKYAKDDEDDKPSKEEDKDGDGLADKDEKYLSDKSKEIEEAEQKKASSGKRQVEARRKLRRKLAQQLYNLTEGDMVAEAHSEGGNESTFPGQPEGKVETQTEQQKANLEVANATPRGELVARQKVRQKILTAAKALFAQQTQEVDQAAADLEKKKQEEEQAKQKLVDMAEKAATEASVKKKAEVDNETKQYYKELASQSATGNKSDPEVGKFYSDLTQDYYSKKATAAVHNERIRTKRAYTLATKRAELGQIENTQDAIESDVDRLLLLTDEQFKHFADVIENTKKQASFQEKVKQVRTAGALNVGVNKENHLLAAPESEKERVSKELSALPWS